MPWLYDRCAFATRIESRYSIGTLMSLFRKAVFFLYYLTMGSHLRVALPLRRWIFSTLAGRKIRQLNIRPNVYVTTPRNLRLGDRISINHNCVLLCEGGLTIGDDVSIAHSTSIITTEHSYDDPEIPIKAQPIQKLPVRIGSNIWIGARVTILAGVSIADGTIVAAGAVVTKDITEPDTIVGGVPARFIKSRFA